MNGLIRNYRKLHKNLMIIGDQGYFILSLSCKGEQISQLQSLFESCSQERSSLEIKSVSLEKKNNELDEKVQNLLEKVKYVKLFKLLSIRLKI